MDHFLKSLLNSLQYSFHFMFGVLATRHMGSGFPWWLSGKESACQCRRHGSIPWSGRSLEGGNGNPLQYSCLGNTMDRGAWGCKRVTHDLATNHQQQHVGSQLPNQGSNPHPLALEDEVLPTEPPRKSLNDCFLGSIF